MSNRKWDLYQSQRQSGYAEVEVPELPDFSFQFERLSGGLSDGVDLLTVKNGNLAIKILPTRGMGIWDMTYDGTRIGWQSPVRGPVHPNYVNLAEPSGLAWLDGFDELLVRCGLQTNGAPEFSEEGVLRYPLHGRIANLPARHLEIEADPTAESITVTGIVEETRFHFAKLRLTTKLTTRRGQKGFTLCDSIENLSESSTNAQLLYHLNIGLPLLQSGTRIVAPLDTAAPRDAFSGQTMETWDQIGPAGSMLTEQAYYLRLLTDQHSQSRVVLQDEAAQSGVSLGYDAGSMPCFTFWKNPRAASDGYVVGLEPGTNYPNPHSFEKEQGRTHRLPPYGAVVCQLCFEYLATPSDVVSAVRTINQIQGDHRPNIQDQPVAGWSPTV
ncbi:hypothetical protein Pla123a_32060 [Posidoniimonas polymericola]|uniref:DUF4432 domain-containing protein n=1 Tax=Posidoniimonas polymericola TaxID=2528002 RepID=A0A5C5YLH5_9BACT|nr:aldose 1-epimerase family protein [Posidoniimonas polymericola]TWT75696.1 hypothetical protein Pla123a_32060 [Posidoniimonas polymericola]